MIDSIETMLAAVVATTTPATTAQAAYFADKATCDSLGVVAQIQQAAVLAARQNVRAGSITLGQPAVIQNADETDLIVGVSAADRAARSMGFAKRPSHLHRSERPGIWIPGRRDGRKRVECKRGRPDRPKPSHIENLSEQNSLPD